MRLIAPILLLASAISFGLGISLPIVRFQKLYIFEETPSLITLVFGLWEDGSVMIALAVILFSLVFPVVKLAITFASAFTTATSTAPSRSGQFTSALAKWSMMDVLLVALVIFAAKSSGLASAAAQPGIWFYAASAICGAIAAALLRRTTQSENLEDLDDPITFDQEGKRLPGS